MIFRLVYSLMAFLSIVRTLDTDFTWIQFSRNTAFLEWRANVTQLFVLIIWKSKLEIQQS